MCPSPLQRAPSHECEGPEGAENKKGFERWMVFQTYTGAHSQNGSSPKKKEKEKNTEEV